MSRLVLICLLALALEPLKAQDKFIAPNEYTVIPLTEQSNSDDPVHMLYVSNNSTVPIVLFGITLSSCENVRQSCGSRRTNIKIDAGRRANVGRVEARDKERAFGYRWAISYHADSSDAKVMAMLREHGIELDPAAARRAALAAAAAEASPPAPTPAAGPSLEHTQAVPSEGGEPVAVWRAPERAPRPPSRTLRFKVGWGSILGSTMVPDKPVLATGSCVDPVQTAKLEKSPAIERTPWRPARLDPSFGQTNMPREMRDSLLKSGATQTIGDVLVRFAADTAGTIIPESVSVLESPSGQLSAKVCTSVMSGDVEPAKNKEGHAVPTWVQTPVRIVPF